MSKVLILGCGPAGLMSAHASSMGDHDVIIVSKARKSYMRGAQYLHEPIPLATPPESGFRVSYELRGSVSGYREKIYGRDYRGTVSPEEVSDSHLGYDIRQTYDWLWETYGDYVFDEPDIGEANKLDKILEWAKADYVISTVPAHLLCIDPTHRWKSEQIWSTSAQEKHELFYPVPINTVICNGEESPAWYRAANIQGHLTVEWPSDRKPPIPGIVSVEKPISTTCDCYPDIARMGRYGQWKKGVLSHTAFAETRSLLSQPKQMKLL